MMREMNDMDDETCSSNNDDVVKEIDVYLSRALLNQLYIFQYPSRPSKLVIADQEVIKAKFKPKQQKVELEMSLNIGSPNYCVSRGEQIALNIDDKKSGKEPFFQSCKMDKHVFTSTKATSSCSRYAVGFIRDGKLHITPVTSVLQLRPSFDYINKSSNLDAEEKEDEEEEPQAVGIRFAAGPSQEKKQKARQASYKYIQQKRDEEPWVQVDYHPFKSYHSEVERDLLLCPVGDGPAAKTMSANQHLQDVLPECLLRCKGTESNDGINALSTLKSLPLAEQLRQILLSANVVRFHQLEQLLAEELRPNMERLLQQFGILVQGCWVVKSDILYPKNSTSPITGISSDILIRARDYILWSFTKSRYITREYILSEIRIPHEDVTSILKQIAKKVHNKWEFKYSFDNNFIESYPTIAQRQDMLWGVRYKQLIRELGQMRDIDTSPKKSFPPAPQPRERKQLKYRDSISDDTEDSGPESSMLSKIDVDYSFKRGRSPRKPSGSRKRTLSGPLKGTKLPPPPLTAVDIPPTFLLAIPSIDIKLELLNHIREIMFDKYCTTLESLKKTLYKTSLEFVTEKEDCSIILEETLSFIEAQCLRNKWPQNTQPVPLYAFTKFGSSLDRYREALLELFTNTARSRPKLLAKKIEDEYAESIPEILCKQIFEEYCIYKDGYYYLKGTISLDS